MSIVSYPARPVAEAVLGYNVVNTFNSLPTLDFAADGGATIVRGQFGWSAVENYDTGALALSPANLAALAHCATRNLKPCIVAGYGPPYKNIATLTVAAAVPAGQKVIPVTGDLSAVDVPSCHVMRTNNQQIVRQGRWAYYGALIDQVGEGTITLAAVTNVALVQGDQLKVNRLRYPSIGDERNPTDPSAQAFVRYAKFIAEQIAAAGCEGYVCLWNEAPWTNDVWSGRTRFYDPPFPSSLVPNDRLRGVLSAALNADLPEGVSFVNGASDKTGFSGIVGQGVLIPGASTPSALAIQFDGIHPYNGHPEGSAWNPGTITAGWYAAVDPLFANTNFRWLALINDNFRAANGFGPRFMATEFGNQFTDPERQATHLLRQVISLWGMGVVPVPYSLTDGAFAVAPGLVPRRAYSALKRLMELVGRVAPGSEPGNLPIVGVWPHTDIEPMTVGLTGAPGHGVLFAWLRTRTGTTSGWEALERPTPRCLSLTLPAGVKVGEAVNLRTGAVMIPSVSGQALSVPVDDDPVALRWTPQ